MIDVLQLPKPVINFLRTMTKDDVSKYAQLTWDIAGDHEQVKLSLTWTLRTSSETLQYNQILRQSEQDPNVACAKTLHLERFPTNAGLFPAGQNRKFRSRASQTNVSGITSTNNTGIQTEDLRQSISIMQGKQVDKLTEAISSSYPRDCDGLRQSSMKSSPSPHRPASSSRKKRSNQKTYEDPSKVHLQSTKADQANETSKEYLCRFP
ncbi:hypothetical protein ACOME3_009819 [Neoechinorhynchus agilis]